MKRIPGAEITSIALCVRGGVRNWTAADAGIEQLAFQTAVDGGTERMNKDAFTQKLSEIGTDMHGASGDDFASIEAKGLTTQFDTSFDLLADAFLTPALPPAEIEQTRQKMLSTLRHELEQPDGRLALMVNASLFKGHPYENRAVGTVASVQALTAAQARAHLAKLRETSRLLIVVVGDVTAPRVEELVKKRFGALSRGSYQETPLPSVKFAESRVDIATAALPTNYIEGAFAAPGWRDAGFYAAMIGVEQLQHQVFQEVRTKRNLSYAPNAGFRWARSVPYGFMYVTAVDPNATIQVMYAEAKKLRDVPLDEKALLAAKSTLLTRHLMGTETTDGQADALARAQISGGDWRLERTLIDRVKAVTAADVQTFARTYIAHLQTSVIGDTAKIDKGLFGAL